MEIALPAYPLVSCKKGVSLLQGYSLLRNYNKIYMQDSDWAHIKL